MNKQYIYITSIYDLENALRDYMRNENGYNIFPDFELIYIEYQKYLLIIK